MRSRRLAIGKKEKLGKRVVFVLGCQVCHIPCMLEQTESEQESPHLQVCVQLKKGIRQKYACAWRSLQFQNGSLDPIFLLSSNCSLPSTAKLPAG